MENFDREELISICENAVVSFQDWNDRDSYSAQVQLSDIYHMLKCGFKYQTQIDNETIWINFIDISEEDKKNYRTKNYSLNIDSREDYLEEYGYDSEMFDAFGISLEHPQGYIPTREKLNKMNGKDWY
jgi:hypothetical protein